MGLKAIVPLRARSYVRARQGQLQRAAALRRGLAGLRRQPHGSVQIWRDLVEGWGNGWAAHPELLGALAVAALAEPGPILECGSGLTTLVLATVAQRTGSPIWSLEHDSHWFHVVSTTLRRFGLRANVCLAPLRDHGDCDWYDVDPSPLPRFSLVLCDGPPAATRGGRYGLLPVLRQRLAPSCTILLDDAARPGEREVLQRWRSIVPASFDIRGEGRPFAVVTLESPDRGHRSSQASRDTTGSSSLRDPRSRCRSK